MEVDLDSFSARDWEGPTDADPMRFAMVGLGWWTREQAIPAVEEADYCATTVLVSSSTEKADELAADLAGVEETLTYEEYADGAATDAYDAVYVCTPNGLHRDHVEAAAAHDKAVLCEKPLEATVEDARASVDACREADVPLMVAYRVQTEPTVRRARELIRDGAIGDVVSVLGHMSDTILDSTDETSWRFDPDLSGGTTINDIGIYPLNTIRFVLEEDPQAVYARTESEQPAYEGTDEHAAFQLEFPDGKLASCTVTHSAAVKSSLRFVGTEGELSIEGLFFPNTRKVLRVSGPDIEGEYRPEPVDQMREEFDYFANRLQRGLDLEPDGEHGMVDMHAVRALYDSAERGRRVELDS
ncbi:D-xylose 1-dehydrogenase Gfo6 [Halogeometricum luteum]|uniref:Gfo/Idh/MocA family oxidoreductase n=1 Tax=Halogeometricum luteum TaxID=2950537 RepID=A0ABU2G4Q4_9EURY|nr:D-xylose 1-dehydrogenase Gfo6 [Halogeometricum sp. S3BR5-2]MDS0295758.1 Gfo/Idh/MocA family oxidoreductase [Halogeometricum sp. S3BR5-2]